MTPIRATLLTTLCAVTTAAAQGPQAGGEKPEFPPFEEVSKDYEKVVTTSEGAFYTLYHNEDDNQLLAELPRDYDKHRVFLATTLVGGAMFSGFQLSSEEVYWRRIGDRLAVMRPNFGTRSSGDLESQKSRDNVFTDSVLMDVPIVTMGPGGGPVVDLDEMLVGRESPVFGNLLQGAKTRLTTFPDVKAFPQNVEVTLEVPAADGQMLTLHASISKLPENTGYQPRTADQRVGYFTVGFRDLGDPSVDDPMVRYVTRFHLEKADPSLRLSPPKQPIVYYIDHKTPIRYRRWVRDGILEWNKAFERVGIADAIEVRQQDARTGAHMDKDPADVRYNFVMWNSNAAGFAIALKRVDPRTGQILDTDVVMQDGWVRGWSQIWRRLVPQQSVDALSDEALAWLSDHPEYDPRTHLAPLTGFDPAEHGEGAYRREAVDVDALTASELDDIAEGRTQGVWPAFGQNPASYQSFCTNTLHKSLDMQVARMALTSMEGLRDAFGEDAQFIDGAPEDLVGAQVKDVVQHEVGHQLGLRHNFKGSTVYDLSAINSEEVIGKPFMSSVMDYNPININVDDGPRQGDWTVIGIGPYDQWAIKWGYGDDEAVKAALDEAGAPEHQYATDEDTTGQDPLAWRHDIGKDPLDFAESRLRLANTLQKDVVDKAVEEGQSWTRARDYFGSLVSLRFQAATIASRWIGGAHIHRTKRGDVEGGRLPIEPADVEQQRRALRVLIDNSFYDDAFGLTPELINSMPLERWIDNRSGGTDGTYPVHNLVVALQSTTMTSLLNPTTLTRVYDNEFRVPSDRDALTLPELMNTIRDEAWSELSEVRARDYTNRRPLISSFRRNLQRQHLSRLIDLSAQGSMPGVAGPVVATLAADNLRTLGERIDGAMDKGGSRLDDYTLAHLRDARTRIDQALDAVYVVND